MGFMSEITEDITRREIGMGLVNLPDTMRNLEYKVEELKKEIQYLKVNIKNLETLIINRVK
jgi:hypothetical protein